MKKIDKLDKEELKYNIELLVVYLPQLVEIMCKQLINQADKINEIIEQYNELLEESSEYNRQLETERRIKVLEGIIKSSKKGKMGAISTAGKWKKGK